MELILLDSSSHQDDVYPYKKVVQWVSTLLDTNFLGRDIIIKQLTGAKYELDYKYEYLDVKFQTEKCEKYPFDVRVPVELLAKQTNQNIVNILLHVIDGYASILDLNNLDFSDFDGEFSLDDLEYRINDEVKPI